MCMVGLVSYGGFVCYCVNSVVLYISLFVVGLGVYCWFRVCGLTCMCVSGVVDWYLGSLQFCCLFASRWFVGVG